MKKLKLILVLSPVILVLAVLVFALVPSAAKAQGLVEYALCETFPSDTGTGITDSDDMAVLGEIFNVTWSEDYGVYTYCAPVFTGSEKMFTGIRSIAIAYQDQDGNGSLSPYDTEVGRFVQVRRF